MVFVTRAQHFLATPALLDKVFGPAALLIEASGTDEMIAVANYINGQLTATLHLAHADTQLARTLLPIVERKAGRILVNGFPTGVEVSYAMVHGGPSPATSDSRVTSVGAMSYNTSRTVCYQGFPNGIVRSSYRMQIPSLAAGGRKASAKLNARRKDSHVQRNGISASTSCRSMRAIR